MKADFLQRYSLKLSKGQCEKMSIGAVLTLGLFYHFKYVKVCGLKLHMISYYPQKNVGCQEGLLLKEKETRMKNRQSIQPFRVVPPPKEKKPLGRPKKNFDSRPPRGPSAATSGGRGGKGPTGARGGRGSSAGTSGGRGGRSFIDEIFDSPMENEVIDMFDNFEEELRRAAMERREGEPMLQFPEYQFNEGVPIAQDDGVDETQDVVPETQFDIENANLEDQYNVVGRIGIDVPVIRAKLKPRKPSERII
ncbi:unnamed protein product [Lactuca saligna]|uniref:Uncharacterized protein n=1 Tax=Lactuca saligna TaxID=75948 RepID=A0AA36EH26_LACSI|nr:unnamed protein product [Lactuca saligna]